MTSCQQPKHTVLGRQCDMTKIRRQKRQWSYCPQSSLLDFWCWPLLHFTGPEYNHHPYCLSRIRCQTFGYAANSETPLFKNSSLIGNFVPVNIKGKIAQTRRFCRMILVYILTWSVATQLFVLYPTLRSLSLFPTQVSNPLALATRALVIRSETIV